MRLCFAALTLLILAGTFVLDLWVPSDFAVWLAYSFGIFTASQGAGRVPVGFTLAATVLLTWLPPVLASSGATPPVLTNRTLGVAVLVLCGVLCLRQVRAEDPAPADAEEGREREELLRRQEAELGQLRDELEELINRVAHDLSEPARKIRSFGELLREECREALPGEGPFYLERMKDACRRLQAMLDDLLVLARVHTRGGPFREVDLGRLAEEVVRERRADLERAGGRVEIGPLPTLEADSEQMREVLRRLLDNALTYRRPEGPLAVTVQGEVRDNGQGVLAGVPASVEVCLWTVRDNGIGFTEADRERIFAPFERLHGRGTFPGAGMGLAICRKIVQRHRGVIEARGLPGEGSTFSILLPRRHSSPS